MAEATSETGSETMHGAAREATPALPARALRGERPFFVYNEAELIAAVAAARAFWSGYSRPGFRLYYSVKSNPQPRLLQALRPHVDGFDVSSLAEARLIRNALPAATRMTWSGPAKTPRALRELPALRPEALHLDSFDEWLALGNDPTPRTLRLNLDGVPGHKLGFSRRELARLAARAPTGFIGLHAYLGRESFSREAFAAALAQARDVVLRHPDWFAEDGIFLGAGLPIREAVAAHPDIFAPDAFAPEPGGARVVHLECGRGLVQSCGSYAARVLSVKSTPEGRSVIIDGGLQHMASHLLSPRFGKESVRLAFFRGAEPLDAAAGEPARINGSLSLWHDVMIEGEPAPKDLKRGDWVAMSPTGAYGWTAASNQFLGPTPVSEYFRRVDGGFEDVTPPHLLSYHQAAAPE